MSAATTNAATVTTPGDRDIRVERIFDAPLARVWRACTEPELLKQWWGRGNDVTIERWEFERGGHWRFVERSDEGEHGFEGRFREITPMERVVQSFEWDGMPAHVCIETAEYTDLGDGRTRIVTTSLFHTAEERDGMVASGMESGLQASYTTLDRVLTTITD